MMHLIHISRPCVVYLKVMSSNSLEILSSLDKLLILNVIAFRNWWMNICLDCWLCALRFSTSSIQKLLLAIAMSLILRERLLLVLILKCIKQSGRTWTDGIQIASSQLANHILAKFGFLQHPIKTLILLLLVLMRRVESRPVSFIVSLLHHFPWFLWKVWCSSVVSSAVHLDETLIILVLTSLTYNCWLCKCSMFSGRDASCISRSNLLLISHFKLIIFLF